MITAGAAIQQQRILIEDKAPWQYVGISRKAWMRYENDDVLPSKAMRLRIAEALHIEHDELFYGCEDEAGRSLELKHGPQFDDVGRCPTCGVLCYMPCWACEMRARAKEPTAAYHVQEHDWIKSLIVLSKAAVWKASNVLVQHDWLNTRYRARRPSRTEPQSTAWVSGGLIHELEDTTYECHNPDFRGQYGERPQKIRTYVSDDRRHRHRR